jgi:hypothetical protein
LVVALSCAVLFAIFAYPGPVFCAQTASAPDPSSDAVGAVVDLLKAKGVISAEDAAGLSQKMGKAGGAGEGIGAMMDLLQKKGVISAEEAAAFKQKYEKPAVAAGERRVIRIVHEDKGTMQEITKNVASEIKGEVQDQVKTEIKEDMAKEAKAGGAGWPPDVPEWVQKIRWSGDIRLRYEGDYFNKNNAILNNPASPTQILDTRVDQDHALVRARLEADVKINDQVEADIRLSTGNDKNPLTTNANLGNYFNKADVIFDRAFIDYTPTKDVSILGGIMGNPFFHTDMVWEPDLSFDGLAVNAKRDFYTDLGAFVNAGIFPLDDESTTARHRWLYGGQLGLQAVPAELVTAKLGVAFYDFQDIVGLTSPASNPGVNDYSAPIFQQKGNTLFNLDPSSSTVKTGIASDFKELNLTESLDLAFWDPVHVIFTGDYIKNLGFDRDAVAARTGLSPSKVSEETTGYLGGVNVGYPKIVKFPDWQILLYYEYLEADAALDAFTDTHFHAGGTNAKGWVVGGEVGLLKNTWLRVRWYTTDEISGPPLAIDTLLVDFNGRF